jgi:asparagine synthase (glutamine-hydrolysing)
VIALNGEVYNHARLRTELTHRHGARFATTGDAEAVLAALHYGGIDAVARLRGMFAFTVWDRRARRLVVARDRFGIKPLYHLAGRRGHAFASGKAALLALGGVLGRRGPEPIDPVAVQDYLALQYVPEPRTAHPAVRQVGAGTVATVRPGGVPEVRRWFHPVLRAGGRGARAHNRITAALADSVAAHLQADVPVGAFLSGGIDSAAVVALAARHDPDLIAFTAAFDVPGYSEADDAAATAAAVGVQHVVRTVRADEVAARLPEIVAHLDDPVADPAMLPLYFVAEEARKQVTAVVSGEGADELFAGYRIYAEPRALAPFEVVPAPLRALLARAARRLPDGVRGVDLLRRGALPIEDRYYGNARPFRADQLAAVLRTYQPGHSPRDVTADSYRSTRGWDPVSRMQHVDLTTWLPGDILVVADRMTMAHSLELRVPFLDPLVFEAARDLPRREKLHAGTTKYALRQALAGIVPEPARARRKLGFPVPLRQWLRGELHDWAREVVRGAGTGHLLDHAAVGRLLDEHRAGRADHSRRIWSVLVLMTWHRAVVEQPRLEPAEAAGTAQPKANQAREAPPASRQ